MQILYIYLGTHRLKHAFDVNCQLDVAYSSMVLELQQDLEHMVTRALVGMERIRQAAVDDMEWTLLRVKECADAIDRTGEVRKNRQASQK